MTERKCDRKKVEPKHGGAGEAPVEPEVVKSKKKTGSDKE